MVSENSIGGKGKGSRSSSSKLMGLRYGSFKRSSVMQLNIRQFPLQRLSIVPCFAFCQNYSGLDEGSIIEEIIHFPGQLQPQSLLNLQAACICSRVLRQRGGSGTLSGAAAAMGWLVGAALVPAHLSSSDSGSGTGLFPHLSIHALSEKKKNNRW